MKANGLGDSSLILATDDEMGILTLYRHLLEGNGFRVIGTDDSREALHVCQTQQIALVVCDIVQPYMNGLELLAHLRADPATRHLPVIVVSARGDAAEMAFQLGADSFFHKPFHPAELLKEIHRLLAASVR